MKFATIALAAALALGALAFTACTPPQVVCSVSVSTVTAGCTIGGVTVTVPIPPDVATVVGITPAPASAAAPRAVEETTPADVRCVLDTRTRIMTCTNSTTKKAGAFPV